MKNDREQQLVTRLSVVHKLSLSEAMELLDISESTARRMFAKLERDGIAIRTHGGLQSLSVTMTVYSFEQGAHTNIERKTAIARAASRLVDDGDVIFCDSGTTIQCLCAELVSRVQKEELHIKLYTNSLANLELLAPYMQVNLVGGEYRENRKDFCGYLTEQALQGICFTKSFVGADGCLNAESFTTTDFDTARMNQIAIRNSEQTFLLADSSKFGASSHVAYVAAEQLSCIVTDDGISEDALHHLREKKVRLEIVSSTECKK